jgi:hypothetical protein
MPWTEGFTCHKDLLEIQWRNRGETGGGIMKNELGEEFHDMISIEIFSHASMDGF